VLVDAGHGDDPTAATGADHPLGDPLYAHETTVQIGCHGVPPLLQGQLEQRLVVTSAGVIDEHVAAAELVDHPSDHVADRSQVGGVKLGDDGPAPDPAYLRRSVLGARLVAMPRHADVQTGLGQGHRGGPADTRV
jgi:hypothetical protein